ncbi:PGRP [Acanthosepion pharaonis]|uniref:PGRP n=1 Tax=Acanthosepion pharaonis TaxID=158019 RepID=A0A812EGU8_ACAPH|nr:PGRP [Sepia pharaonis]
MKFSQVLMLCLWLRSTSTEPLLPTCACTHKTTMLHSSLMKPMGIVSQGKCFQKAEFPISGSRWIRLLEDEKTIYALRESLTFRPCYDRLDAISGGPCPNIISRSEWGARRPRDRQSLSTPVKYAVVHHSNTPQCLDKPSCIKRMQSIQNFHMNVRRWSDIAYNFLIGGDGNVYEGRGWDTVGAHVIGYNKISIGICVIGNYTEYKPNEISLNALKRMLSCLEFKNKVINKYVLRGHRDLGSTTCPGNKLYRIIKNWHHYYWFKFSSAN